MRKNVLIISLMLSVMAMAQSTISFKVSYDKVEKVRGELYQYSERYLGTKDVVKENSTTFMLKELAIEDNNETVDKEKHKTKKNGYHNSKRVDVGLLVPLSEEALMATNTAKKAELVARQIYRIREMRMNILGGEVEHVPADGQSMSLVLGELNRLEQELTSMFIGTTNTTHHTKVLRYNVCNQDEVNDILMRFSKYAGPVAKDDLSGTPLQMEIRNRLEVLPDAKKKKIINMEDMYIVESRVTVFYNGQTILDRTTK